MAVQAELRAVLLPVGPLSHRRISSRPAAGLTNPLFQEGTRPHQLSRCTIGSPRLLSTTAAPRDARPLVPNCPLLQVGTWCGISSGAAFQPERSHALDVMSLSCGQWCLASQCRTLPQSQATVTCSGPSLVRG